MIVMLEGTDGVGKSTTAAWVAAVLSAPIIHFGIPDPDADPIADYVRPILDAYNDNRDIVLDRSPLGSRIWSDLGFHPPTLDEQQYRAMARFLGLQDSVLHVMVRPEEELEAELLRRGESRDTLQEAQEGYFKLVASHEILYVPTLITTSAMFHHERD